MFSPSFYFPLVSPWLYKHHVLKIKPAVQTVNVRLCVCAYQCVSPSCAHMPALDAHRKTHTHTHTNRTTVTLQTEAHMQRRWADVFAHHTFMHAHVQPSPVSRETGADSRSLPWWRSLLQMERRSAMTSWRDRAEQSRGAPTTSMHHIILLGLLPFLSLLRLSSLSLLSLSNFLLSSPR